MYKKKDVSSFPALCYYKYLLLKETRWHVFTHVTAFFVCFSFSERKKKKHLRLNYSSQGENWEQQLL